MKSRTPTKPTKPNPSYTPPHSQANAVDPSSSDFGAVLNCAVRYCIGRRTYMPSLVIGFIKPLIPQIETRTLVVMRTDIQEAYSLGDECDERVWEAFREQIEREIDKRRERA